MDLVVLLAVKVPELVVEGDVVVDLLAKHQARLVGPASRHVFDGVASAAQQNQRNSEVFHDLQAFPVALHRKVHASQQVLAEGIGAALHNDHIGAVAVHHSRHHSLEKVDVGQVFDAAAQRHIHSEPFACAFSDGSDGACFWEKPFGVLVEADSHDSVCVVEGLFDAVAVVHIDVQVQNPAVDPQQLQDAEHDVIYVAKTAGRGPACVVEAAHPVYGDVSIARYYQVCRIQTATSGQSAVIVQSNEPGTVLALVYLEDFPQFDVLDELLALLKWRDGGRGEGIERG